MLRAVIVGGGLAGLVAAYRLAQLRPDVSLTVLEAAPQPGGNIGTRSRDGFTVELGPNGFLDSKPGLRELCQELKLDRDWIAASDGSRKNRYVYAAGRIQRLPAGPWDLLTTPLLSVRGKLELLAEPFRACRPKQDESVEEFACRRFGRESANVFLNALVTGVHAADWSRLSVQAAFPTLAAYERDSGSVVRGVLAASRAKRRQRSPGQPTLRTQMWSFRNGLQHLIDTLVQRVGSQVQCSQPVERLERDSAGWQVITATQTYPADAVILALPAYAAAPCLAPFAPQLASDLAGIEYSPVAVVALGYRASDCPAAPNGFGYIAPPPAGRPVLGVQWCSAIFPDRAPAGHVLWRVLCGGAKRPDIYALPDEELVRVVHQEMQNVLKVEGNPVFTEVVRWPRAIPHYSLGHLAREERIRKALQQFPRLAIAGNALGGVAMNDVVQGANAAARRIATDLPTPSG